MSKITKHEHAHDSASIRLRFEATPGYSHLRDFVFGSIDGRLYILDLENGKEMWSYEVGAAILSCPAVVDGMIVIGAEDGRVYAFGENK